MYIHIYVNQYSITLIMGTPEMGHLNFGQEKSEGFLHSFLCFRNNARAFKWALLCYEGRRVSAKDIAQPRDSLVKGRLGYPFAAQHQGKLPHTMAGQGLQSHNIGNHRGLLLLLHTALLPFLLHMSRIRQSNRKIGNCHAWLMLYNAAL